jgi:predicted transcriptional regulator
MMFGVRIPRRVVLQLDYLARSEERSRQWVFERRVAPLIERLAEDLWKEKEVAEPTGAPRAARKRASPG